MMKKFEFLAGFLRIPTDILAAFLAWQLAYFLRPWTDLIPRFRSEFGIDHLPTFDFFLPFSAFSAIWIAVLFATLGLFAYPVRFLSIEIFAKIFWGTILWGLSIIAFYALVWHELIFSRIMLAHAMIFTILFSFFFRFLLRFFHFSFSPPKKISLIGSQKNFDDINIILKKEPLITVREKINLEKNEISHYTTDEILFFEGAGREDLFHCVQEKCAEKGIALRVIPQYASEFWGHARFELFGGMPTMAFSPMRFSPWWSMGKRFFDIFFSFLALLFFSPIFLVFGVLIKLDSSGPVFYVSRRVGKNGKEFFLWKFRSMGIDADQKKAFLEGKSHRDGPLFKIKNDPRITKIGRFLRRTSLDELPQLINVFKGEMSLIGPRPHLPEEIAKYTPSQKRVLAGKPGITGLAQVSGRSDLSFEQEIFYDLFYVENANIFLDAKIFFRTPFVLMKGKGAD